MKQKQAIVRGSYGHRVASLLMTSVFIFTTLASGIYTYTRTATPEHAYAATSSNLNFQARIYGSAGNTIPDGYYNIRFNLYNVSSGGSSLWNEEYYDSNGVTAGNDNRVRVVNGYFSANLGSQTAFPGTMNWDQEHWLTMNVGGSTQTATPTYDGEMNPRIKLTAVPYAFRAGQADNVLSSNTSAASTNSSGITIQSGNATGATSNSGNVTLDVGTATQTTGTLSIGTTNTSGVTIGRAAITTILQGSLRFSAFNCTTFTNGGALTTDASGNVSCSNDDGGGASGVTTVGAIDSQSKSANGAVISGVNIYLQTADATYPGLVSTGSQTFAGDKTFNGTLSTGTTSVQGALSLFDGTGQKTTLQPGNSAGDLTFILPTTIGNSSQCLKNSATAGTLEFANCNNGSGAGGSVTLQDAYDAGNTIATTNARDISFTSANTATDGNFIFNVATSSTGQFKVQNNGSDVLAVGSAGQVALSVQGVGGGLLVGGDANLYRSAADTLKTDDAFLANGNFQVSNNGIAVGSQVSPGTFANSEFYGVGATYAFGARASATGLLVRLQSSGSSDVFTIDGSGNVVAASNVTVQGNTSLGDAVADTTDITGSIATKRGADYTTAGSTNNVNFGGASLVRLDTAGAAQTITGITAGRDGQILTLVNADASAAVTLTNNDAASLAANRISTGTGASISIAAGSSITLIYDTGASLWRVVGGVAGGNGTCASCANTSLSNLSSVAINTALLANADNTIDLGSSGFSFRTLYADTSVLTPAVDTAAAGALSIGNATATSVSICNAAACDTVSIATNADADAIQVGDSLDTFTLTAGAATSFVINGVTVSSTEFNLLDGRDTALVDVNDAVNTAITGTGALNAGSITSGFGTIDNADTITGTTLNATTGINTGAGAGTQRIDATGNLLNIGNLTSTGTLTVATASNGNIVLNANGTGILDVQDNATFAGTLIAGNEKIIGQTRTLPIVVGDTVDIGSWALTNGGGSFKIEITVPNGGYSQSKQYNVPVGFNGTGAAWRLVAPIGSSGPYSGNDFNLEINVNSGTATMRLRRAAGTTAGTAYINIAQSGITTDAYTASSTVTVAPAAVTTLYSATGITQINSLIGLGTMNPATGLVTIGTDTTTAAGGLYFGTDTSLYRQAADYLRTTATFDILQTSASAFAVREATGGVASFLVNTTSNTVNINNGADLTGYSGDFGSQTFNLDAANGSAQLGSSVTTSGVLNIGTNTTGTSGGIYFGTDTNLYRNGANYLQTDSSLRALTFQQYGSATTSTAINVRVGADAVCRFCVNSDGAINWGDGTAALDTSIYRSVAGRLYTPGQLYIGGAAQVQATGKTALTLNDTTTTTGITIGADTNIFRSTANVLATDDSFSLLGTGSNLTVQGTGTSTFAGSLTINGGQFTNQGSTLNTALGLGDFPTGGSIGSAATTVDIKTTISIAQTTAGQTLSLSNPTTATAGRVVYVLNTGSASFTMHGVTIPAGYGQIYIWNGTTWILGASGGGSAITLQSAYDGGNTITSTNARNLSVTLADTATDANFILNVATGSTSELKVQSNGTDVLQIGAAGQLQLDVQGIAGGILIGTDTNLYRSAANTLKTDDELQGANRIVAQSGTAGAVYVGNSSTTAIIELGSSGDTNLYRDGVNILRTDSLFRSSSAIVANYGFANEIITLGTDGKILFAADTNLYRSAANTLMTDDALTIAGLLTGQAGATIAGAGINLNNNSNFATNINTGTSTGAITIGNSGNAANTLTLEAGTTSTGIQIGNGATAHGIQIGSNATGDNDIVIGGTNAGSTLTLEGGTAASGISIGASNTAHGIQIGTGSGDVDILIGSSSNAGSSTYVYGKTIGIGYDATSISVGGTVLAAQTVNIGVSTNEVDVILGSTSNAGSTTEIRGGTSASAISLTTGLGGSINLNAGTILGTATTQNLFNTVATTLNIGGATTTLNIGPTGSGASSIILSGGSADTGCSINGSNGNLTCSGTIATTATSGTQGWWSRTGTTLQPTTAGDNIQTTSAGTITSAGLLTGQAGLTVTGAAVNLNASSNFATNINTGTSTGAVTIGNTTNAGALALRTSGANNISLTTGTGGVDITSSATGATALSVNANSLTLGSALVVNATSSPSSGSGYVVGSSIFLQDSSSGTFSGITEAASIGISNRAGVAHTQNALEIYNSLVGSFTDTTTENLLLIDQADTTASGNTAVTNALNITNSGGSTLTNAITVGSGAQVIGTAINLNSTGITTDIRLQNGETIDNNVDGAINFGGATSITTDQTTVALFNTTATTLNIGGAAGAAGINLAGGTGSTGCTIDGTNGNLTCSGSITGGVSGINNSTTLQTSANFHIQSAAVGSITAEIRELTGQTADFIRVRNAADTANLFRVTSSGIGVAEGGFQTNTNFTAFRASGANNILVGNVGAEAFPRFQIRADGTLDYGSGTAAADTNLYRSAVDTLQSDSNFVVQQSGDAVEAQIQINAGTTVSSTANATLRLRENGGASTYNNGFNLQYDTGNNVFELQAVNGGATSDVFTVDRASGITSFKALQNSSRAFTVQETAGNDLFTVDNSSSLQARAYIGGANLTSGAQLHFRDSTDTTYVLKSGDATYLGGEKGLTFATAFGATGDVFALSGTNGAAIFKPTATSSSAFQIQNTAGEQILVVNNNQTSQLANPGVDTALTGWSAKGASTVTRTTTTGQFLNGSAGISVVTTAATGVGVTYAHTLSASTQYTLSFYVKASGASISTLAIGRQDVSGTDVDCAAAPTVATGIWTRINCTFTTGATITSSNIYLKQTDATARTFYVDSVQLQTGASTSTYKTGTVGIMTHLGVGIADPEEELHVIGDILLENSEEIRFKDASGTQRNVLSYSTANNVALTNQNSTSGSIQIENQNNAGSIQLRTGTGATLQLDIDTSDIDTWLSFNANNSATATTGTTSGTGTNTTTVTLTAAGSFANNDVILIDNAGQDYYTRIVSGGGTTTLTVSPAVTFETARTVTKYTIQNIGATTTSYTTQTDRFFQGYFLGGIVAGAGSTIYGDSSITMQGDTNLYRGGADDLRTDDTFSVGGSLNLNGTFLNLLNTGVINIGDTNLYRASADVLQSDDKILGGLGVEGRGNGAGNAVRIGGIGPSGNAAVLLGTSGSEDTNLYRSAANTLKTDDNLVVGTNDPVSAARLSAVGGGNGIEFGHANTAGYRSVLGANVADGKPFLAFNAEAGTTNNTFRTRGVAAAIIQSDIAGGLVFGNLGSGNADNQTLVNMATLNSVGTFTATGNVIAANGTQIGNHVTYGSAYAAFYKTGSDYSILTEGTNTYINAPAASGDILFRTANADKVRIVGSTGYIGVGDASPSAKLSLGGTGVANGISLGDDAANNVNLYRSGNDSLRVDDALLIGGGYGTMGGTGVLTFGGGGGTPDGTSLAFGDNTGWKFNIGTNASGTFTPRVTFMDTGNVGIGTTSPTLAKLQVGAGNVLLDNNQAYQVKNTGGTAVNVISYTNGNVTHVGANQEIQLGGQINLYASSANGVTVRSGTNNANSLLVQNAASQSILQVDSTRGSMSSLQGDFTFAQTYGGFGPAFTNLVSNASFEGASTTSWATYGTNTIASNTTQSLHGSYAMQATYNNDLRLASIAVTTTASTTNTLSAYVYIPTAWDGGQITIVDDGQFAGATLVSSSNANMALRDQWQLIHVTYAVAADNVGGIFLRTASAATAGRVVYFDNAQTTQTTAPTTFSSLTTALPKGLSTTGELTVQGIGNSYFAGRVGIGVAAPAAKLQVTTSGQTDGVHVTSTANTGARLFSNIVGGGFNTITQNGDAGIIFDAGQDSGNFVIAPWVTTGTKGIRMTNTGSVGIGVASPGAILEVLGYSAANSSTSTAAFIVDSFAGSTQTVATLQVAGTDRARIRADNGGSLVLSGTGTGPTYLAWDSGTGGTIFGNGGASAIAAISSSGRLSLGGNFNPGITMAIGDSDTGITSFGDGDLGIYANNTQVGRIRNSEISFGVTNGTTAVFNHNVGANYMIYDGDSNIDFASDQRLKSDITDSESILDKVMDLQVRRFYYNNGPQNYKEYGFISQEVQALFPELVTQGSNSISGVEDPLMLAYTSFGVLSIKAVQELNTKVESLQQGGILDNLNVSGSSTLANLTVTGDAVIEGKLTVASIEVGTIKVNGHIVTAGEAPQGEVLGASGTGAIYVIDGNDTAGTITITTGSTSVTAGDLVKITFKTPFGKAPKIIVSAQNQTSMNAGIFPSSKTLNDYMLRTDQVLAPNTTYTFDYFIVE